MILITYTIFFRTRLKKVIGQNYYILLALVILCLEQCSLQSLHGQEDYELKKIKFNGNNSFSENTLEKQIVMRENSSLRRLMFWKEPYSYNENILQRDTNQIIQFYQTEGFLQSQVNSSLNVDEKEKSIEVIFNISEGSPVIIQSVKNEVIAEDSLNERRVRDVLKNIDSSLLLRKGNRYRDITVNADQETIASNIVNFGYPYATVQPEFQLDKSNNVVDIVFHIATGPRCYFGDVTVTGNMKTPGSTIQNQVAFERGDIFSQDLIQKSQRRIYQLGVFQYVSIKVLLSDEKNKILPVQVLVKEAPRLTSKIGVGFGKEDKFRTFLDLRRLGFLGGARRLTFYAKHSGLEPYHLSLKLKQPGFINPKGSLTLSPFIRQEKEPGFTIDRVGANVIFQQRFAMFTDGYLNYSLEQDNLKISQITREQALNNLDITVYNKSSVTIGLARDSSSPPMFPNSGLFTSMTATLSGIGFKSDFHYARILLEARSYQQLSKGLVLAYRAKIGVIGSTRKKEITPLEERFYSGGSSSVRGWGRSQLGPKSKEDRPLGGNSFFEGSCELRYPIWKWISGVYFIDCGNVWRSTMDYRLEVVHFAGGIGLRFRTLIGPLRLDVATPIFEKRQHPQYHISVGHAF